MKRRERSRNGLGTTISNSEPRQRRKRPEDLVRSSPAIIEGGAEADYHLVASDDAIASAAQSHGTATDGVLGVVSAPRSRRADRRRRDSKASNNSPRTLSKGGASPPVKARGPWLSADGLSVYLALPSAGAVRELERRGVIPGHRLGGSLKFSRPEIDTLLLESRQATVIEIADNIRITVPPADGLGPLMSPEQAVAYLDLPSAEALNHRVRRGEVPCYRIGKQLRFRAVELDSAMKDEGRLGPRRLSAAERQLTFNDNLLTPEGRRPFAEGKGGNEDGR